MGYFCLKLYKIYQAYKSVTKNQFTANNPCYHTYMRGVKYYNDCKVVQ